MLETLQIQRPSSAHNEWKLLLISTHTKLHPFIHRALTSRYRAPSLGHIFLPPQWPVLTSDGIHATGRLVDDLVEIIDVHVLIFGRTPDKLHRHHRWVAPHFPPGKQHRLESLLAHLDDAVMIFLGDEVQVGGNYDDSMGVPFSSGLNIHGRNNISRILILFSLKIVIKIKK